MRKALCFIFFAGLLFSSVQAQLCTGSFGDPVVNITFGNQGTTAAPLKAGVTNLQYLATGCPIDGNYTITNATAGCWGSSWHNIPNDHTGDNGGRFMLINASFAPDDFYVDTVKGLCKNTIYQFSAWITNVLSNRNCGGPNTSIPNLTFTIETITGTVLTIYKTGDIAEEPTVVWKEYGFVFQPNINTSSVVLRIRNNAPGNCGNDLALDDIQFRPCGPKLTPTVANDATIKGQVCEQEQKTYLLKTDIGNAFADPLIQWQISNNLSMSWSDIPGAVQAEYLRNPTPAGNYRYRMQITEKANASLIGCTINSPYIDIDVLEQAALPLGVDTLLACSNTNALLTAPMIPGATYYWQGPAQFSSDKQQPEIQKIQQQQAGEYTLKLVNAVGCASHDTLWMKVINSPVAVIQASRNNLCEGDTVLLTASGGKTYQWTPATGIGDASAAITNAFPSATTTYKVTTINEAGCADSADTQLMVIQKPLVQAGADKRIFAGGSTTLDGQIAGQYAGFEWAPASHLSNAYSLTPLASPIVNTRYVLRVESMQQCGTVTDTVDVNVYDKVEIPNAFSPNGDGINDRWIVPGLESYPQSAVQIFNRDGQVVFQSKPYQTSGWDGNYQGAALPSGVYYYIIERGAGHSVMSGTIIIIR
ncbi:MAG TPA: gliding motility-associated C-terminal domain-containing protein [Sediminibacterium sp.]|nr:gliding motility-associated C-terminal domain-containing protein [Sediminibacterium sp.]